MTVRLTLHCIVILGQNNKDLEVTVFAALIYYTSLHFVSSPIPTYERFTGRKNLMKRPTLANFFSALSLNETRQCTSWPRITLLTENDRNSFRHRDSRMTEC